jgi:S1-C subfamily serine protease
MKRILLIILTFATVGVFAQSTNWNEYKLKEHWKTKGVDEIEGIYEKINVAPYAPKYKLGLIKTYSGYNLVYITGAYREDMWRWNVGDVKAYLTPTATPYLFKTKWYMGDKTISQDLYITFEKGIMKLNWTNGLTSTPYLKLYPTADDNITQSNSSSKVVSGTGFAISSDGIIVTNYHVIEGATTIKIRGVNSDFNKTHKAKVLVSDKNNDLALIQIDEYSFTSLGTITYTLKTKLANVGENIFALGYPLRAAMGDEIKLTNGIISSKTGFQGDITSYQFSAPVQPGNSGGPLFDSNGNVIGIINAKLSIAENASYAVKVSYLMNLIELLNTPPKLPTYDFLKGKSLTEQVKLVNKFVYIIETE